MWTSTEYSARRAEPTCPSKNLPSLPVPFLEDLNKKNAEHLKIQAQL
jgi:hypothetical protein